MGVLMTTVFALLMKIGLPGHDVFMLVDPEPFLLFDVAAKLYYETVCMVMVLSLIHI